MKKKRTRRLLPKIPSTATLESSNTSLEDLREDAGSAAGTPREERPAPDPAATTTTTAECKAVITHPTQTTFACPECGVSYNLYASLQRHMRDRHKDRKVTWVYVCVECEEEFPDKKKVSALVKRVHAGKAMKKFTNKGAFPCDYCKETFQSSRSRSMHVRNQHAATQSARLAEESSLKTSADSQPRHWDDEMVRQFVRALFAVGTGSNVEIAREMKSKNTAHNVKGYKLRFLKDHPDWKTEFRQLDPEHTPSDSERPAEEEEVSAVEEEETIQPPEREAEPESTAELVTLVEVEATLGEDAAVETEPPVEKEPITEDAAVETEPPHGEETCHGGHCGGAEDSGERC